jgi:hypothetical protein
MLEAKKAKAIESNERRIRVKIKMTKRDYPEFQDNENDEYLRSFFEKKYNYRKKPNYEDVIRRPRPDDLPSRHSEEAVKIKSVEDLL